MLFCFDYRKCFEATDCKEGSLGTMAECDGGTRQNFVFEEDLTVSPVCNRTLYLHISDDGICGFSLKNEATPVEIVPV